MSIKDKERVKRKLPISEMFYSIQGEGRTAGVPAFFLRLRGCNLLCGGYSYLKGRKPSDGATWVCDTIDVWRKGKLMAYEKIVGQLEQYDFLDRVRTRSAHIIFTGGEPLLHQIEIQGFMEYLYDKHRICAPVLEIETNGTLLPISALFWQTTYWNVSPKLANSGMKKSDRIRPPVLERLARHDNPMFKFVISSEGDLEEIERDFLPYIGTKNIWLMPAGESVEQLVITQPLVADICKAYGFRYSPRLHINIWNQKTGV